LEKVAATHFVQHILQGMIFLDNLFIFVLFKCGEGGESRPQVASKLPALCLDQPLTNPFELVYCVVSFVGEVLYLLAE
jgi:hypothetical protein